MTPLFTIGYEGSDIERFVRTLKLTGVSVLADVRAVPISRKRGFSKNKLRERLAEDGIRYVHFAALGDPKEGRDAARAGQFDRFRKVYSSHLSTADAQAALNDLADLAKKEATCLMCFERDPKECHRLMVADALPGAKRFDLFADEPER